MLSIPATTAVGTSAVQVATVPPGVCTVILSNTGGANVIYVGLSNAVTSSGGEQGFPLPANTTVSFAGYPGSKGAALWAISTAATQNLGVIISTGQ